MGTSWWIEMSSVINAYAPNCHYEFEGKSSICLELGLDGLVTLRELKELRKNYTEGKSHRIKSKWYRSWKALNDLINSYILMWDKYINYRLKNLPSAKKMIEKEYVKEKDFDVPIDVFSDMIDKVLQQDEDIVDASTTYYDTVLAENKDPEETEWLTLLRDLAYEVLALRKTIDDEFLDEPILEVGTK